MGLTYKNAGVDVAAGERLVDRIKPLAARTRIPEVLTDVGGFAGLCSLPAGLEDPVLVSGTDGVGTKLKVAFAIDVHDTVGIDLVAMCVNDVLTVGARPLFFLDYFATGKLDVDRAALVVEGIARGCEEAGCALLGGETAELPGFYADGEYDLAGFAVGVAPRARLLDGRAAREGDVLVGLPSSGVHANGLSLARKALLETAGLELEADVRALGTTLGRSLLTPTRIYAKAVSTAMDTGVVRAMCHVTGGGLPGNLPRVLPPGLGARIQLSDVPCPPIFDLIQESGRIAEAEMRRAFNLGVGYVFVVPEAEEAALTRALEEAGEAPFRLGAVAASGDAQGEERVLFEP